MKLAIGDPPTAQEKTTSARRLLAYVSIAVGAALAIRLFLLIDRMAVDVMFWDQYGYYTGVWNGASNWQLFRWQHGPHRMGLGFPIMAAIDEMTGWNQRVQAFVVGITMCLACAAALWLKRRLTGSFKWYDIAIPLLFLTNRQWELYASCVNLSHGALPLLLIVLIALAWLLKNVYVRYVSIAVLAFGATFTGFGFFAAVTVAAVCVIRSVVLLRAGWRERKHELLAMLLCIGGCGITLAEFFREYVFEPAAPGFVFPHPRPLEYVYFAGLELAYMLGARAPSIGKEPGPGEMTYGLVLLAILSAGALYVLWRSLRKAAADDRLWHVLLFLVLFTAAFLVNSAIGRVCTGLANAMASRYVPLLMPGMLAMYLMVLQLGRPMLRVGSIGALLLFLTMGTCAATGKLATYYVDGKRSWIAAYKQTHSIAQADQMAKFQIFPDPLNFPIQKRLDWLEERKLSLFRE